jgi:hemolysin activation/secretion protein
MNVSKISNLSLTALAGSLAVALPTLAQQAPDAGQTLRQLQQAPASPTPAAPGALLDIPRTLEPIVLPGGPTFEVKRIVFEGNRVLSNAQLDQVVAETLDSGDMESEGRPLPRPMDLAGLARIANRVTQAYKEAGYLFAQALLPAQKVVDGQVRIVIIEGVYGQVRAASADPLWKAEGQKWLAPLVPGRVIQRDELERVALLLSDLPGVSAALSVESGAADGSASVEARLERRNRADGELSVTNHGSRYSGEWHTRAQVNVNSPFMLGDQLVINALHSDYKMWQVALSYNAPLGTNGLRAQLGYSDTRYQLTKGFEGTSGNATVSSAGLAYPLVRTRNANLRLVANVQEKRLYNSISNGATTENYRVTSVPVTLAFDQRDGVRDGDLTYGALTWTPGRLSKDDPIRQGGFYKLGLDVSHIQPLDTRWSLFGRIASQWAPRNLDSAEGFGLGGANGVRAYPSGEAFGDIGTLAQIELRMAMGSFTPYAFYDFGKVQINAKPELITSPSPDQTRAGIGVGLRFSNQSWKLDAAIAWRTEGGPPTATQGQDPRPRFWIALSYQL